MNYVNLLSQLQTSCSTKMGFTEKDMSIFFTATYRNLLKVQIG